MRFIHLVHFDTDAFEQKPLAERQEIDRQGLALNAALARNGRLVLSEALQSADTAKLVRVRDGRVSVTDGPYIETKEQLAGFVLFEARDMADAVTLAHDDPFAAIGAIEVRPVYIIPTPS